ncbi:putative two-component histidine kinase [Oscillibacter valericigenes Sjm18-20]|nr:putative two-component histidine kinase [Oscillibacter valericigenes Sjm18-20]
MDWFTLLTKWLSPILCFWILNGSLAWLEMYFFGKFVRQPLKWYHYAAYILTMYFIYGAEIQMRVLFPVSTLLELTVLFIFGCLILKCSPILSAITTILTISVMQVLNGIFQSIINLACTFLFYPHILVPVCVILTLVAAFFSYRYIAKLFSKKAPINWYMLNLLLPILFILLVIQHIFIIHGDPTATLSTGDNWCMLLIQIIAYFCLFSVLFAYRKLSDHYELQIQNALLEQEINMQKNYMQEVQTRYEKTAAFRHDIKNHWVVLMGLLKNGEIQNAFEYLNKLEAASDTFSFFCHTGNIVIDMLLANKLGLAQQNGIRVDCTMKLPGDDAIDNMDLCIVFANAVDNAIKACNTVKEGDQYIRLSAVQKGKLLMVEIENSRSVNDVKRKGTGIGLQNIKAVAEKYNGTVSVESNEKIFKLNILFIISLHSDSI